MINRRLWGRAKNFVRQRLHVHKASGEQPTRLGNDTAATVSKGSKSPYVPGLAPPPENYDSGIRLEIFRELLKPMRPGRLLDVAAGHGAFSIAASELGWKVTAVDARSDRFPSVAGIDWIEADLRTFKIEGFDVICLLGILYHLQLDDQLDLLRRCAGTPTIIDTHTTQRADTTSDGYQGWLFQEHREASTASWGNIQSFWPTRPALDAMLADCGYRFVFRLEPEYYPDRTFYLCL